MLGTILVLMAWDTASAECNGGMCTRPTMGGPAFRQLEAAAASGEGSPNAGAPSRTPRLSPSSGSGPVLAAEGAPSGVLQAKASAAKGGCAKCKKKGGSSVSGFFASMGGAVRSFFGRVCRACGG